MIHILCRDYFHKYAPVLACIILPNNPNCAIMEFNDRNIVKKILSRSQICINDANLTLKEVSHSIASLLNPNRQNSDSENEEQFTVKSLPTEHIINSFQITTHRQSNPIVNSISFISSSSEYVRI